MFVPLLPVVLGLMIWTVADIVRENISVQNKILLTVGVLLLTFLGMLIYWCWLRPGIKSRKIIL